MVIECHQSNLLIMNAGLRMFDSEIAIDQVAFIETKQLKFLIPSPILNSVDNNNE